MIAKIILSVLLCGVLVYAWVEARRSRIVAGLSLIAASAGLYFVWFPSHSTRVAEFVGVGRGADLILYLWVCISLIMLLNLHLKLRSQNELITALARKIALTDADVRETPTPITPEPAVADPDAAGAQRSRQMAGHPA